MAEIEIDHADNLQSILDNLDADFLGEQEESGKVDSKQQDEDLEIDLMDDASLDALLGNVLSEDPQALIKEEESKLPDNAGNAADIVHEEDGKEEFEVPTDELKTLDVDENDSKEEISQGEKDVSLEFKIATDELQTLKTEDKDSNEEMSEESDEKDLAEDITDIKTEGFIEEGESRDEEFKDAKEAFEERKEDDEKQLKGDNDEGAKPHLENEVD